MGMEYCLLISFMLQSHINTKATFDTYLALLCWLHLEFFSLSFYTHPFLVSVHQVAFGTLLSLYQAVL